MSQSRSSSSTSVRKVGATGTPSASSVHAGPGTPSASTPVRSRLPARTPGGATSSPASKASASPAVRARLLELRKQARAAQSSPARTTPIASPALEESLSELTLDPDSRPTSRASGNASSHSPEDTFSKGTMSRTPSDAGRLPETELAMTGLKEAIKKAKTSGRLNISSRSLFELPFEVFDQLMSHASLYHPSSSGAFKKRSYERSTIDLSMNAAQRDVATEEETAKWWELADLVSLKASNNELTQIDESLAGFEHLQVLDLHNNLITSPIPASFALLAHLTNLDLSGNQLTEFPNELMALVHLKELDLSRNKLQTLWRTDWNSQLQKELKVLKSQKRRRLRGGGAEQAGAGNDDSGLADTSFESTASSAPDSHAGDDFWSVFPSSPVKGASAAYTQTPAPVDYSLPLPSLVAFNLSHNSLSHTAFASAYLPQLPPSLVSLNLSNNSLRGPIPLSTFSSITSLKTLNLARNELVEDGIFDVAGTAPLTSETGGFPSLVQLDLSGNAIDSLAHLESVLSIASSHGEAHARRPVTYTGIASTSLQRALKLANGPSEATSEGDLRLEVNLADNFLREELARRKKERQPANPERRPSEDTTDRPIVQPSTLTSTPGDNASMLATVDAFRAHLLRHLDSRDQSSARELQDISVLLGPLQAYMDKIAESPISREDEASQLAKISLAARRKQQQEQDAMWAPL